MKSLIAITLLLAAAPASRAAERDTIICLIPDTQWLTIGATSGQVPDMSTCQPSQDPSYGCKGEYCKSSPYCKTNWIETHKLLLRNLAYELTGQWEKIDYTEISGGDTTKSHQTKGLDHPRCDLILGLGDITNNPDGVFDFPYDKLQTHQDEWKLATENLWSIIDASGIPYLPSQGNHDSLDAYKRFLGLLGTEKKPWFYTMEKTRRSSYAIKPKLASGLELCVVGLSWRGGTGPDRTERAWARDTWGCGANLPTIGVQHSGQGWAEIQADPRNAESFFFAHGHWITIPFSAKQYVARAAGGFGFFNFFSNWQARGRWDKDDAGPRPMTGNGGRGNTTWDGLGTFYTVVRVSPAEKKVQAWDWSPYFLSRNTRYPFNGNSSLDVDFDFDARYSPGK